MREGVAGQKVSGFEYDPVIYGLCAVLQPNSLVGLYCTRLLSRRSIIARACSPQVARCLSGA